ncbi:MAG: GNAT family N-acetyltransferase [Planctomycetota bacterium]
MPAPDPIETDRLTLRPIEPSDLDAYAPIFEDPEVMRYITNGEPQPRSRAETAIEWSRSLFDERSIGIFVGIERATGTLIGDYLLIPIPHSGLGIQQHERHKRGPDIEIGYRLARSAWGKGYATEGAKAVIDYAVNGPPALAHIVGVTELENVASQRVLEKIGLTAQGLSDRYYDQTTALFEWRA